MLRISSNLSLNMLIAIVLITQKRNIITGLPYFLSFWNKWSFSILHIEKHELINHHKIFFKEPRSYLKKVCVGIFDHILNNVFSIVCYSFKDICYESNILYLCSSHELTCSAVFFMLIFVYLGFIEKK